MLLKMETNELTHEIIGSAMSVHSSLGPGLLESAYRSCLCHELTLRGISWEQEVPVAVSYKGQILDVAYRLDLVVQGIVVVEVKAVTKVIDVHQAQLLSYLRLSDRQVGLLINFHVKHLRHGATRMVNNFRG